eukprot:354058-Chlamydomonas_euryale.AAC.14
MLRAVEWCGATKQVCCGGGVGGGGGGVRSGGGGAVVVTLAPSGAALVEPVAFPTSWSTGGELRLLLRLPSLRSRRREGICDWQQ